MVNISSFLNNVQSQNVFFYLPFDASKVSVFLAILKFTYPNMKHKYEIAA